jgi:hypothetical protein
MTSPPSLPCWLRPRQRISRMRIGAGTGRAAPLPLLHAASSSLPPARLLVRPRQRVVEDVHWTTDQDGARTGGWHELDRFARQPSLLQWDPTDPWRERESLHFAREVSPMSRGRQAVVPPAQERIFARICVQQAPPYDRQPIGLTAAAYVVP